jgi:hypothetical protein
MLQADTAALRKLDVLIEPLASFAETTMPQLAAVELCLWEDPIQQPMPGVVALLGAVGQGHLEAALQTQPTIC